MEPGRCVLCCSRKPHGLCCITVQLTDWKDSSQKWPIVCWRGRQTLNPTHSLNMSLKNVHHTWDAARRWLSAWLSFRARICKDGKHKQKCIGLWSRETKATNVWLNHTNRGSSFGLKLESKLNFICKLKWCWSTQLKPIMFPLVYFHHLFLCVFLPVSLLHYSKRKSHNSAWHCPPTLLGLLSILHLWYHIQTSTSFLLQLKMKYSNWFLIVPTNNVVSIPSQHHFSNTAPVTLPPSSLA